MADQSELRMNLAAVKRTDPYAAEIVETSAHVAFYTFNYEDNEWEKTDVEGAFFVYRRTAEPFHSIFINNRLNTESLVEPVTADLELQAQPPFLLYRNQRSRIRGFWFYNKDELDRVATLVNKLVKECQMKQQQQQPTTGAAVAAPAPSFLFNMKVNGGPVQRIADPEPPNGPLNIFSMLSKAQNDFDQSNLPVKMHPHPMQQPQQPPRLPPQPHMDAGGGMLAALLPKMSVNGGGAGGTGGPGKEAVTSQSVMNFFASAAKPTPQMPVPPAQHPHVPQQQKPSQPQPVPIPVLHSNGNGGGGGAGMKVASPAPPPPLLQRLMSNPVPTLEEIEMQHRAVTPQAGQKQEQEKKPPGTKENGFNWKTKGAGDASKLEASTTTKNDKDQEMWPALLQQKGKGGNKSGGEAAEKLATAVNGPGGSRKAQTPKGQAAVTTAPSAATGTKPALMTPTMFKKAEPLSKVDPTNPSLIPTGAKKEGSAAPAKATTTKATSGGGAGVVVDLSIKPEPLTQSQMLQAMTYLMKTDTEFMRKLHEAYVKSFAEMMGP